MITTQLTLHPRGSLRAKFAPPTNGADAVVCRPRVGAPPRRPGGQRLHLPEEIVAADRWLNGSDPQALGILVLALMIAQRQGSSRLPLDPKGRLRTLVGEILRVAGVELDTS